MSANRTVRRLSNLVIVVLIVMVPALSGCQPASFTVEAPPPIVSALPDIDPAVWAARGSIVTDEPQRVRAEVANEASQARHVTYRSVSGVSGAGTEVSGTFYLPNGTPPPGGWPVIGLAHGYTGASADCAPSGRPDLHQYFGLVTALLTSGFAIAFTDYEGLGGPGLHPLLEPRGAAFNVIDSVRVLRTLFPDTSTRWVAFGISQGGQASWSANELNEFYGDGLELVGATAIAPAANMAGVAQLAYHEALSAPQRMAMPVFVVGAERSYPPVPVGGLLRGAAARELNTVIGCRPESDRVRAELTAADVKPDSEADAVALETSLRKMTLPTRQLSAPLFVLNGSDDDLVLPEWVETSVSRACALGGQIVHEEVAGADHSIQPSDKLGQWVTDRFAGTPAPSTCTPSQ